MVFLDWGDATSLMCFAGGARGGAPPALLLCVLWGTTIASSNIGLYVCVGDADQQLIPTTELGDQPFAKNSRLRKLASGRFKANAACYCGSSAMDRRTMFDGDRGYGIWPAGVFSLQRDQCGSLD